MKKRTQLNIEVDEDLLRALKFMALSKNIKLNTLVKEILYENTTLNEFYIKIQELKSNTPLRLNEQSP